MSGVSHAMLACAETHAIYSVGLGGTTTFGFRNGVFGSCSPSSTFRAATINEISTTTTTDFIVDLSGVRPQNYFKRLLIQCTDGSIRTYQFTDVSNFVVGSNSVWFFGNASNKCWTGTGASPRSVALVYQ